MTLFVENVYDLDASGSILLLMDIVAPLMHTLAAYICYRPINMYQAQDFSLDDAPFRISFVGFFQLMTKTV